MSSKLEKAICKKLKIKKVSNVSRQKWLEKLCDAIQELSDDEWDELDSDIQEWANTNAENLNSGKPVIEFPDFVDEDVEENGDEKPKEKPKEKVNKKPRGVGVAIKEIMIEDPFITTGDLIDKLSKDGYKCSEFTVSAIRADFRQSLKVLAGKGLLIKSLSEKVG